MEKTMIKLISNPKKEWAKKTKKEVKEFLKKVEGIEILEENGGKKKRKGKTADITICIGGDGTILYNHFKKRIEGAVLGIGTKSSVICQLRRDNWKEKILKIIKKNKREKRLTLLVNNRYPALNDIVVHSMDYRVLGIDLEIGKHRYSFYADGIIISTPTGSSGYAYSAGGPILRPNARNIEIVGIAPYKRAFAPTVVSERARIKVSGERKCSLIIDGIFVKHLKAKERITIKKGEDIEFLIGEKRKKFG